MAVVVLKETIVCLEKTVVFLQETIVVCMEALFVKEWIKQLKKRVMFPTGTKPKHPPQKIHIVNLLASISYPSSTNRFLPSAAAVANSSQRLLLGLSAWPFTHAKLS